MSKFSHFLRQVKRALPFNFVLERNQKNSFYYQRRKLCGPSPQFFVIRQTWINIHGVFRSVILVSILILRVYNFFFVLQDLIIRIDSYFQRIAFQGNLFLVGFWHSMLQVLFIANKQPSLEWRCINSKGEIMVESSRSVLNIKISILLKKGWFSCVRVSLKREE